MTNTIKIAAGALVAGFALVLLFIFSGAISTLVNEDEGIALGAKNATTTIENPHDFTQDLKASSTFNINNLILRSTRTTANAATTTPWAIPNPIGATSTLDRASLHILVSSTTASTVTVAKAATCFATTTVLASASVSAGAQSTIVTFASSTSAGAGNFVFGPTDCLVVGMQGSAGTFSPTGELKALWLTI